MLGDSTVVAMVAVSDLAAGKEFYSGKLGLTQVDENPGGVSYKSGSGLLFMYIAPSAGKNEATSANWDVDDIEAIVADLKGKGITFENYEIPGATREGDIMIMGPMKAAWFKDPDGNILGLTYAPR